MGALSGTDFLMVRGSETRGVTLFFQVPYRHFLDWHTG